MDRPSSRLPGFYKLAPYDRIETLSDLVGLTAEERYALRHEALSLMKADDMVENAIGVMGVPLGLAANLRVNERDYLVPMAVEEPSVVAAASHVGKLVREHGTLTADSDEALMIGQIQVVGAPQPQAAALRLAASRERILTLAAAQDPALAQAGGGVRDLEVRTLSTERGEMIVAHLIVDVRDAMGANAVNSMAEAVAPLVEEVTGGRVRLRILSNLADRRLARARLEIDPEAFTEGEWRGADVAAGVLDAWALADADPYRAATHNKGVMNGIDAVALATGNDWRAIEAGAHAWAAHTGRYRPLSRWSMSAAGRLVGEVELPLPIAILGGAIRANPTARIALKILGVGSARELAEVTAAVGLVQNLAALRSLVTEGIQKGHMVLHARNVAMSAGAVGDMVARVAAEMVREGHIRFDRARDILKRMLPSAHIETPPPRQRKDERE